MSMDASELEYARTEASLAFGGHRAQRRGEGRRCAVVSTISSHVASMRIRTEARLTTVLFRRLVPTRTAFGRVDRGWPRKGRASGDATPQRGPLEPARFAGVTGRRCLSLSLQPSR